MDSTAIRLTLEEFLDLPDPEDGSTLEFWDGEVVSMPPAGRLHGAIAAYVTIRLGQFCLSNGLGPVFGNDTAFALGSAVVGPDVAWVYPGRYSSLDGGRFELAPDLVIEVLSPHDLDVRVAAKTRLYLDAGVRRVWIIRPGDRSVTVRTNGGAISELRGDQVLESEDAGFPVAGFKLRVDDIFDLTPLP